MGFPVENKIKRELLWLVWQRLLALLIYMHVMPSCSYYPLLLFVEP
eukprot:UN18046